MEITRDEIMLVRRFNTLDFGRKLQVLRVLFGYSQTTLANLVEVNQACISRIESCKSLRGVQRSHSEVLKRILGLYGLTPEDFVTA